MPLSRNPSVRGTRSAVHRSRRSPVQHRPRHRHRRWYRWHHHHHHPRPPPAPPRRLCPARTPCRPWRPLPLATTLRHPLSLSVPLPTSCWRVGEALAPDDTAVRRLRRGSCDSCPRTRPAERRRAITTQCPLWRSLWHEASSEILTYCREIANEMDYMRDTVAKFTFGNVSFSFKFHETSPGVIERSSRSVRLGGRLVDRILDINVRFAIYCTSSKSIFSRRYHPRVHCHWRIAACHWQDRNRKSFTSPVYRSHETHNRERHSVRESATITVWKHLSNNVLSDDGCSLHPWLR